MRATKGTDTGIAKTFCNLGQGRCFSEEGCVILLLNETPYQTYLVK